VSSLIVRASIFCVHNSLIRDKSMFGLLVRGIQDNDRGSIRSVRAYTVEGDSAGVQTIATEREIRLPRRDINFLRQWTYTTNTFGTRWFRRVIDLKGRQLITTPPSHFCEMIQVYATFTQPSNQKYLHQDVLIKVLGSTGVPLPTKPGSSLTILPLMRILQRNLKRTYLIV
jgi:hypothetical protein